MAVTGICFGTFVLPRVISSPTTAALLLYYVQVTRRMDSSIVSAGIFIQRRVGGESLCA